MRYIFFIVLVLCNLFVTSWSQPAFAADESPPTLPGSAVEQNPKLPLNNSALSDEQKSSIVQFYTWSGLLPKDLVNLKMTLDAENFDILLSASLEKITADIRDLKWDVNMIQSAPYLKKMHVDRFERKRTRLVIQLAKIEKNLTDAVTRLSVWRNEWTANKTKLKNFTENEELSLALAIDNQSELDNIINSALDLIDSHLSPALVLGKDLANLEVRLYTIKGKLQHLDSLNYETRYQQTFPTLLSADFYKQIDRNLLEETYSNTKYFFNLHYKALLENIRNVLAGAILFVILCGAVHYTKSLVIASSRWYPFASCPAATAAFLITASFAIVSRWISVNFETQWGQMTIIVTLIAVTRLVRNSISEKWKQLFFSRLALFTSVILLFASLELPQVLMLLFVFLASVVALILYLLNLRVECQGTTQYIIRKSWGLIPASIIILSLLGYVELAIFTFSTIIVSVSICLLIWMLFHLNSGLLELLLKIVPLTLLRSNIPVIVKSLQPFIALFHFMLTVAILAVIWDLYPSVDAAMMDIDNLGFDVIGLHVSPGFLLTIFVVLYGSILFSRAIQALLLKEILPRYNAEKGVQLSITRLVHYAILTIGFFIMLKFLGFELQQLTILGGALGVGIGFGLQAIVNNFVSGLILLFERPIKVGDTIQVGTELGEVKKLGLRATIIQTFDNAEIVVPNGDLITGQVTNWTLAGRQTRVRIPVGVAYGTDVAKVLEILTTCAESHPMVLSTPKPVALFLAFGASSLDFELRFWILEYLDKLTATSELNQAIESEFAIHNIEIPFLQTDLHIRSVDPAAAMAMSGRQPMQNTVEKTKDEAEGIDVKKADNTAEKLA